MTTTVAVALVVAPVEALTCRPCSTLCVPSPNVTVPFVARLVHSASTTSKVASVGPTTAIKVQKRAAIAFHTEVANVAPTQSATKVQNKAVFASRTAVANDAVRLSVLSQRLWVAFARPTAAVESAKCQNALRRRCWEDSALRTAEENAVKSTVAPKVRWEGHCVFRTAVASAARLKGATRAPFEMGCVFAMGRNVTAWWRLKEMDSHQSRGMNSRIAVAIGSGR